MGEQGRRRLRGGAWGGEYVGLRMIRVGVNFFVRGNLRYVKSL